MVLIESVRRGGGVKSEISFTCVHPDFRKVIAVWKVPSLLPLVLLVRAISRLCVWSIGGMILTGET